MDPIQPPHVDPTPTKYDPPAPTPTPVPAGNWWCRQGPAVRHFISSGAAVMVAVLIAFLRSQGVPVPPVSPLPPLPEKVVGEEDLHPAVAFGWVNDPAAIKASVEKNKPLVFGETPAGKSVQSADTDVFLWRNVRVASGRAALADWYPNVNQKDVGCCVGCGWKHATDVCAAVQVMNGRAEQWQPVSVEVIYGGSRVEVGGGRIQGDGSLGAWANEWVSKKGGVVPMDKYPSADLSTFDPIRARQFGRTGVPQDIENKAKDHPVKGTALVRTWQEVDRAIRQGYPVAVCSDQGFTMGRDAQGFATPSGTWAHCMCFVGVRGSSRPGAYCLNSWGDTAHTGPRFPADAPKAGFWVDAKTVERMVSQGDSYALADLAGFPARSLDWGAAPAHQPLFASLFPVR